MNSHFKFNETIFNSQTYGILLFPQVLDCILKFMDEDAKSKYSFIIGTDSTGKNSGAPVDFITAILVHRIGSGGIYFWHKLVGQGHSIYQRVFKETSLSLEFTEAFLAELKVRKIENFSFEIHVDVGQNGKTRDIINEVVGMIKSSGLTVVTKPLAYAASKVADRHT